MIKKLLFRLISRITSPEYAAKIIYKEKKPLWVLKIILNDINLNGENNTNKYISEAIDNYPKSTKSILKIVNKSIKSEEKKKSETIGKTQKKEDNHLSNILAESIAVIVRNDSNFEVLLPIFKALDVKQSFYLKILNKILFEKKYKLYRTVLDRLIQFFPDVGVFYLRKAELLTNNNEIDVAYQYIKIAAVTKSPYLKFKKFGYENDHDLSYRDSLSEILLRTQDWLEFGGIALRHLDNVEYDEYNQISKICLEAFKQLPDVLKNSGQEKRKRIFRNIIRMRYVSLVNSYLTEYSIPEIYDEINYINGIGKEIKWAIDLADINHQRSDKIVYGILNGKRIALNQGAEDIPIIELFIPTLFYTKKVDEKVTYETVRKFYIRVSNILKEIKDVAVIPFHQMNWRKYKRHFKQSLCISYHSIGDAGKNLIIQESQLEGRCSLDTKGFAGYSSLFSDFSQIVDYVKEIPNEIIEQNFQGLKTKIMQGNLSKYPQGNEPFFCDSKFIFLPLQIPTDIVSKIAFINTIDLLKISIKHSNKDIKLVVKPHPYNNSSEIASILDETQYNSNIVITQSSINNILSNKNCIAVLTTNSGVGLEAFIYERPVYVTGKCDYMYGVTSLIRDENEIKELFSNEKHIYAELKKQKEFIFYYRNKYTFSSSTNEKNSELFEKISGFLG